MAMLGALAVLAGLLTPPAQADPERRPAVTAVTADLHGERLRIGIAVGRPVPFRLALADDPRRLFVDLPEVSWRAGEPAGVHGWVSDVRRGLFRPGRARLVFALDRPLRIARVFMLPAAPGRHPRLVVDLVPTDAASFAAAAGTAGAERWAVEGAARPLRIALDPGHGGRDPGAVVGDMVEKTTVLAFAREFAGAIDRRPGMEAILTRTDDSHVPLGERIHRARSAGADLMISLHADRLAEGRAEGVAVYSLGTGRRGHAALTGDLVRGPSRESLLAGTGLAGEPDALAEVLVGLARRDTAPASERLARSLLSALDGTVEVLDKRPHRHGAFAVLKAADMPAVLVELGFLDNERDRGRLRSAEWRRKAIAALVRGIEAWAESRAGLAGTGDLPPEREWPEGMAAGAASAGTMHQRDALRVETNSTVPAGLTR